MESLKMFWAKQGEYQPCGMFTKQHITILLLCLLVLAALLFLSRNISAISDYSKTREFNTFGEIGAISRKSGNKIDSIVRLIAVLMVILEVIKIIYNFSYGYTWIDAWLPIAFCSIFLYALILSGFASAPLKRFGDAYLSGASIVAGIAYLLFPSTSLMQYPVWHYLSLHSMLFHTMMIYVGILSIWKMNMQLDWDTYLRFLAIFSLFAIIAITLNCFMGCNLMLLREPYLIPLAFLHRLYAASPVAYTIFVMLVYMTVPYGLTYGVVKVVRRKTKKIVNVVDEI